MDMTVFYAAVAAVATGDCGEVEIIHSVPDENGMVTCLTILVRRDARPLELLP